MILIEQKTKPIMQSMKFEAKKIPYVEVIEEELRNSLSDSKGVVHEMCSHILSAGGKRIRPLLVLYSGLAFSGDSRELLSAAVAAELIHMASLVHDDIIDNSYLRRNRPSINKIWGNHFAVLCGDYLFAKAFGVLSGNNLIKSMGYMVEAIQNMCCGEILQAGDKFNHNLNMEIYYDRIAKKTAIFLKCCCKSGACIGGSSDIQIEKIGEYGLNLGYAFQIIDDILDFCGNTDIMGKPKGEDLCQGNITLPVILLLNNEKYSDWIRDILINRELTQQVIDDITLILRESGVINEAFSIAVSHLEKAKKCLDFLPASQYTGFLYDLADMLRERAN